MPTKPPITDTPRLGSAIWEQAIDGFENTIFSCIEDTLKDKLVLQAT